MSIERTGSSWAVRDTSPSEASSSHSTATGSRQAAASGSDHGLAGTGQPSSDAAPRAELSKVRRVLRGTFGLSANRVRMAQSIVESGFMTKDELDAIAVERGYGPIGRLHPTGDFTSTGKVVNALDPSTWPDALFRATRSFWPAAVVTVPVAIMSTVPYVSWKFAVHQLRKDRVRSDGPQLFDEEYAAMQAWQRDHAAAAEAGSNGHNAAGEAGQTAAGAFT